jgi:hypothetical protein
MDFSLEDDCEYLCQWIADDPERDLSSVAPKLLRHLRQRLLFAIAACMTMGPNEVIGRVPLGAGPDQVLAALIGVQLAGTRLPPEWRPQ